MNHEGKVVGVGVEKDRLGVWYEHGHTLYLK